NRSRNSPPSGPNGSCRDTARMCRVPASGTWPGGCEGDRRRAILGSYKRGGASMRAEEMVQGNAVVKEPGREMEQLADRLRPGANRAEVLQGLDQLFQRGTAPDPVIDGFLPGRLLGTSIWGPFDGLVARLASVYMPWKGKVLSASSSTGVNQ